MADGQLIRKLLPFERNFTQLPNGWLRDSRLSPKAVGLLAILMSHDHGWRISLGTLAKDRKVGIDYVRTGINELEKHGYLIRRARAMGVGDDWEIADPSGLSDPALIPYSDMKQPVDNHPLENPTGRKIQGGPPWKIQRLKENQLRNKELPKSATDRAVDNSDAFGDDLRSADATPTTCLNGHPIIGTSGAGTPFCYLGCRPLQIVEAQA